MSPAREFLNSASRPYRACGRFAYHFARGKFRQDPVFAAILARGLLAGRSRILGGGWGFKIGKWMDQMTLLLTGRGLRQLHCRPAAEWRQLLAAAGFDSETVPMSAGTPFANVLMIARPR